MIRVPAILACLLPCLLAGAAALAQPKAGADSSTTHTLALPGRSLAFTATVSTIRLANPAGATQALRIPVGRVGDHQRHVSSPPRLRA